MTTNRLASIAAAFAALALLAPTAGGAAAARPRPRPAARGLTDTFRVTAVGSGTFSARGGSGSTSAGTTFEERATFRWEVSMPRVAFRDGVLVGAEIGRVSVTGSASERRTSTSSYSSSWESCAGTRLVDYGIPEIGADDLFVPIPSRGDRAPEGKENLTFRPFDEITFKTDCVDSEDNRHDGEIIVSESHGQPLDASSEDFDSFFTLPADALDKGKIIQLTESQPAKHTKACRDRTGATSCAFSWRQELTLRRIRKARSRR